VDPDYGMMLRREGLGGVPHYIYGLQLGDLTMSGPGLYTSFQSRQHGGEWYAASFDFGLAQVAALLKKCPSSSGHALADFLRKARPGQALDFSEPVVIDAEVRLGMPQRGNSGEAFIPLVVVRVL
jgi:hypothetical protein